MPDIFKAISFNLLSYFIFILLPISLFSQKGSAFFLTVLDSVGNKPIPYARVHYLKTKSCLTDEKGKCVLFYPSDTTTDSITIYSAGYLPLQRIIYLKKIQQTFFLSPKEKILDEVQIEAEKIKTCNQQKKLKKITGGGFISTNGKRKGSEVSVLLPLRRENAYLKKITFYVLKNLHPDSIRLRINIYELRNSNPDNLIASFNVCLPPKGTGKNEVDTGWCPLRKEREFVISLECLSEHSGMDAFLFSTDIHREGWVRYPGFSGWKKIRGGALYVEPEIYCPDKRNP